MASTVSTRKTDSTETKVWKRMSPEEWKAYKRNQTANFLARKEHRMSQHEKELRQQEREHRAAVKAAEESGEWVQTTPPPKKKQVIEPEKPTKKPLVKNLFANFNDDSDEEPAPTNDTEPAQAYGKMKRLNWADEMDE